MAGRRSLSNPGPVENVDGTAVSYDRGWTFGWPNDGGPVPTVGQIIEVETIGMSRITGARVDGEWRFHRTDEWLEEDRRQFVEDCARRDRERLEASRSEWIGREEHLPNWAQRRLARFRAAGGDKFELEGWGYELVICELAAAYGADGIPERGDYTLPPTVKAIDDREGCSGNQHDCARLLARLVWEGREDEAAGVPAGLSPITGSADYAPVLALNPKEADE